MALHICAECSTKYLIGLSVCPHCGSASQAAPEGTQETEEIERPALRAEKDIWVDFADHLGIDTAGLTKTQIIEKVDEHPYTGRA